MFFNWLAALKIEQFALPPILSPLTMIHCSKNHRRLRSVVYKFDRVDALHHLLLGDSGLNLSWRRRYAHFIFESTGNALAKVDAVFRIATQFIHRRTHWAGHPSDKTFYRRKSHFALTKLAILVADVKVMS
jgi:hypothetical protein